MIKRNGVEVMNDRTNNVSVAKETLNVLKQKHYTSPSGNVVDISVNLDAAINGTILHRDPLDFKEYAIHTPKFEVTNETTANAATRLISEGKDVVALNFASARNQGGGFLSGAIAQEEDLCRCSGLYSCLKSKPIFYNENILCEDTFYTDNIIYSPKVPFFRDENNLFLEEPFLLSIISAPSPNIRPMSNVDRNLLYSTFYSRAVKILQIAEDNKHKNIILGAWGCGAFGNDPEMVAKIFMKALEKVPTFDHICFAVYDTRKPPVLYETFKKVVNPNG